MLDLSSHDSDPTGRARLSRRSGPPPSKGDAKAASDAVAIIGMSCLFPGADGLDAYWRNILGKVDAVTDPPPEARETEQYFDPDSHEGDRVYCKRGGYLGSLAAFDPLSHGIPPIAVGGEPDQWLSLQLARDALADAGCLRMDEAVRRKTAVILGKGTYLNGGNAIAVQHGLVLNQTLEILKTLRPEYTEEELQALRTELKRALPPFNPETMPGLVPNIIVGRIANRLDLMGPSYTVDAACASSLVAVQQAMRCLVSGECDLALAGGSQVWIPMPTLSIFCQLGALSRRQQISPFGEEADGTLLGEGIGMVVLKRLRDAERDGDRIYAVVRGVGVASDGRGLSVMAPRVEGEELALRRAYAAAGVSPRTVGLIEAHGTGTPVGDVVEVNALARVFGPREGDLARCALGTVKSMISHTIPAAGVAGIIKTALSLYHKVLPPTLHCEKPNPKLELEKTPFYLNTDVRPWIQGAAEPRRAGVNAFGFGGINAHAVLEEYTPEAPVPVGDLSRHLPDWDGEACVLGAESPAALMEAIRHLQRRLEAGGDVPAETTRIADLAYTLNNDLMTSGEPAPCRLALVASSAVDLRDKLGRAERKLSAPGGCRQIRDGSGIYYSSEPMAREGKLAFLFPGEGSQYPNMLADLCLHFPEVRECFDQIDRVYYGHPRGYVPSDHIFPRPVHARGENRVEERLWEIAGAVEAVLTANQAQLTLMKGLGLRPDVIVGHSTGEFSALRAAGIFDPDKEQFFELSLKLYKNYEEASQAGVPRAVLLAVGADRERVEAIGKEAGGEIYVAMDNCPHQAVLVGGNEVSERALAIVKKQGLMCEQLNFDRAYHTPLFAPYVDHLRQIFDEAQILPARLPIYSCTTAAHYPEDPDEIRKLMVDHWLMPVEFRKTIETLYEDGVRMFVEVGPRGNLSSFVEDILRGRRFCAVPANVPRRSGILQLNHLVAILSAHGVDLDLGFLYRRRDVKRVGEANRTAARPPRAAIKLTTGFPAMRVSAEFAGRLRAESPDHGPLPVPPPCHLPEAAEADVAGARVEPVPAADRPEPSGTGANGPQFAPAGIAALHANGSPVDPRMPTPTRPSGSVAVRSDASMIDDFLQSMNDYLGVREPRGDGGRAAAGPEPPTRAAQPRSRSRAPFPLLGEVVTGAAGGEIVARRVFDPATDLFLRDHTLGRDVSVADPDLLALPVMPLTMSMEVLAEAAAFLDPGLKVVGFRNLRAFRWIAFDDGPQELQVTARRQPGSADRVVVQLRNLTEDRRAATPALSPSIEATVILAESYPTSPPRRSTGPTGGRPSRLRPEGLYSDVMFHGPAWQGVASIARVADDGAVATLRALPFDGLIAGRADLEFALDPILLDAAGQVIGFWTAERLTSGKVIFPSGLEALDLFSPAPQAGEMLPCEAVIKLEGERRVRSDIEVSTADGRPLVRIVGWEDWRFDLPETFQALILPGRGEISEPWPEPVESFPSPRSFACRRLGSNLPPDLGLWRRVWAHQVLSRVEREEFRRLVAPERRQVEWLAGRTAAKEAARDLLRGHLGLEPPLADIEIRADDLGRLGVGGPWEGELDGELVVSISLDAHLTVALAGILPSPGRLAENVGSFLGIHAESLRPRRDEALEPILTAEELHLLHDRPLDRLDEWRFRCRCAKKAVAKALAKGVGDESRTVSVAGVAEEEEAVFVRLGDRLAGEHPGLAGEPLVVFTARHGRSVVATTLCQVAGAAEVLTPAGTDPEMR